MPLVPNVMDPCCVSPATGRISKSAAPAAVGHCAAPAMTKPTIRATTAKPSVVCCLRLVRVSMRCHTAACTGLSWTASCRWGASHKWCLCLHDEPVTYIYIDRWHLHVVCPTAVNATTYAEQSQVDPLTERNTKTKAEHLPSRCWNCVKNMQVPL